MGCLAETTICLLQAGTLSPSGVRDAEHHLASCSDCLDLLRGSRSTVAPGGNRTALSPGTSVGRYIVLTLIGRGGMGDIYAAYDPELDRKIAVKLLRADLDPSATQSLPARMIREAQAIARLSHPSVVTVYDVGLFEGQVFIAMEFVAGRTASDWVRASHRRWQDTLAVYLSAGRGLAAAHEAGLVHRDFKPQNVMVHDDGSVRIMDFGLARWAASEDQAIESSANVRADETCQAVPELTRTGTLLGTPAYMAPEQRLRGSVDARSDQYSFCLSLREALFGERPPTLRPGTVPDRREKTALGTGPLPQSSKAVPRWLRLAIDRGLAVDPAQRWPSINDLLQRLERTPIRRRRVAAASAVLAIGIVAAFGGSRVADQSKNICRGAERRMDGIWEPPTKAGTSSRRFAIRRAFRGLPNGTETFAHLEQLLDSYTFAWVNQHAEACEATNVRNEQSSEALDLRMDCLGQRLGDLRALSDLFARGDATLEGAIHAASQLPPLESCADVTLLRDIIRPSLDSKGRLANERQRTGLSQARAMVEARRYSEARDRLRALTAEAEAAHNGALYAEALALQGEALGKLFAYKDAAVSYRRAFHEALKVRHDEIAAEAALQLIALAAGAGDPDAETWSDIASDLMDRIGGHPRLRGWMLTNQQFAADRRGNFEAAAVFAAQAIAIKRTLPDKQDLAGALASLSENQSMRGRADLAMGSAEEAMRVAADSLGDNDPERFVLLNAWGDALNNVGRFEEARRAFEDMLKGWRDPHSHDSSAAIYPWNGIARSFLGQGRATEALEPARRAVEICVRNPDVDPPVCADARWVLAMSQWETGRHQQALALVAQAESILIDNPLLTARLTKIRAWRQAHTLGMRRPLRGLSGRSGIERERLAQTVSSTRARARRDDSWRDPLRSR